MGLEELAFDVEGVKVIIKPELQMYHQNAEHDPYIGKVPVKVQYNLNDGTKIEAEGFLRYDLGKNTFIDALTDFVPTDSNDTKLMKRYAEGMSEVVRVYSLLLYVKDLKTRKPIITERNFYRNSKEEWKDTGDHWWGVLSDAELKEIADSIE